MTSHNKIIISPSVLASDFSRLGEEACRVETAGAQYLHLDVMDGCFVPNISFGAPVIASLRKHTALTFDVHLMIDRPHRYIESFVKAGADIITFHVEAGSPVEETIALIRSLGCVPSLCVKPTTPIETVFPYLDRVGMVLVMTVEPGFGGQSFMRDMMPKLTALRAERERLGLDFDIEVDGGISPSTVNEAYSAGANVFVAGSAIFGATDAAQAIRLLCDRAQ